jgi:predicted NBD/HSP70 family sugar kinase
VASSQAIVRCAQAIARSDPGSTLFQFVARPEEINTDVVLKTVEAGDYTLRPVIAEAGRYLGMATANLVGALNIQRIVIAGSAARFGTLLLDPILHEMSQSSLEALAGETRVEISSLGSDIVILGAGALLLSHEIGLP